MPADARQVCACSSFIIVVTIQSLIAYRHLPYRSMCDIDITKSSRCSRIRPVFGLKQIEIEATTKYIGSINNVVMDTCFVIIMGHVIAIGDDENRLLFSWAP